MPILEYSCKACGHTFEFLKLPTTSVAVCPECHSEDLERLPSGFAVNTPEVSRARVRAARRQLRQSKDHKDKQIAEAEHIREHMADHLPPPTKPKK